MMMNFDPLPPSGGSPSGLETLTALLALVTQPDEAREYLAQIAKASLDLDQKRTETQNLLSALKVEHAELQDRIKRETDEHVRKLASERQNFDALCNSGMAEVRRIREGVIAEQQFAGADRQRALELRQRWEQKMKMIAAANEI
jgi:hypothetical protein